MLLTSSPDSSNWSALPTTPVSAGCAVACLHQICIRSEQVVLYCSSSSCCRLTAASCHL